MHPRHRQSFVLGIFQIFLPRRDSFRLVHVERGADFRMLQLDCRPVDKVADNQELSCLEDRMPRRMSHGLHRHDAARQLVAEVELVKPRTVRFHRANDLPLALGGHRHPSVVFRLRDIDFRPREDRFPVAHHAPDMVAVEMRDVDIVNVFRFDAYRRQSGQQETIGAPVRRVEKHPLPAGFEEETADRRRRASVGRELLDDGLVRALEEGILHLPIRCVVLNPRHFHFAKRHRLDFVVFRLSRSPCPLARLPGCEQEAHACHRPNPISSFHLV